MPLRPLARRNSSSTGEAERRAVLAFQFAQPRLFLHDVVAGDRDAIMAPSHLNLVRDMDAFERAA